MKKTIKCLGMMLVIVLVSMSLLVACGDEGEDGESTPIETQSVQDVTITLGNVTDITGPGATAMSVVSAGLEDAVGYYNDNNLIPGVKIKIIEYDNQYDPSKEIPGYQWLRERGSDIIIGNMPQTPITLKSFVDDDHVLLFSMPFIEEGFLPPGYAFSLNVPTSTFGPTMMKWIAENDPDFPEDRPAKVGAVNWDEPQSRSVFEGAEAYAKANPEQYEWVGSYLTDRVFKWGPEVDYLKDCDYVFPPMAALVTFVKEYRGAGHQAKFIGTDGHAAFLGFIGDARLWDEVDGMIFGLPYGWWNDDTESINLANQVVREKQSDPEDIISNGTSYLGPFISFQGMLQMVADAVKEVGAENLTSEVLYEKAQSFSMNFEGRQWGFSANKRNAVDSIGIYILDSERKDMFRTNPEWYDVINVP